MEYIRDVEMITICSAIKEDTTSDNYFIFVDRLKDLLKQIKNE